MYFDLGMHACACVHMVENIEKRSKIIKRVLFSLYARETQVRLTQELEEKCSFLALRSDSLMLVDTQKLVAIQLFQVNLVIFVRESLVSMIKNTDLT